MNVYKQLETIITYGVKDNPLPYKKGNSIRIGKLVIRESKTQGYIIFDCENNKQVDVVSSLRGALAMSILYMKDRDYKTVKVLDQKYFKHYNDAVFYKETIKKTSSESRKMLLEDRLDIAQCTIDSVSKSLEDIIFDNKR